MRKKILFIALAIALAAALVGGSMAYFTAKAQVENEFTAGTVMITADEMSWVGGDIENWNPGDCTELTWEIHNSGTKDTYIRIKNGLKYGSNTAMVRINDDPYDLTYQYPGHAWFTYVTYIEYDPSNGQDTFYFYAGRKYRVGEVDVGKVGDSLNIKIRLDEGYEMNESQVNVNNDEEAFLKSPPPPWSFGNWPYQTEHDPMVEEFQYTIPWDSSWEATDKLYIGVHAVVWGFFGGEDEDGQSTLSQKGYWEFAWKWLWDNWYALCFTELGIVELNEAYELGDSYEDIKDSSAWRAFMELVEGLPSPVTIKLCENNTDWVLEDDDYYYYTGEPIEHCHKVKFCLKVCFDGLASNVFQGATFKLALPVEAVQSSNDAPYYVWGTELYGTPSSD